jgi:hypothetical protein
MSQETNSTGKPEDGGHLPFDKKLLALQREIITYRRELPRLLAEGQEGRFVLIKGDQILSVWDTFEDAYKAGTERFGFGPFLAQPVDSRDLNRVFPKEFEVSEKP